MKMRMRSGRVRWRVSHAFRYLPRAHLRGPRAYTLQPAPAKVFTERCRTCRTILVATACSPSMKVLLSNLRCVLGVSRCRVF